jgi:MFS family permease
MSITALLHPLWISVGSWMLLRVVSGICMAGLIMVTESWLNERASNVNRGQVLSFYMITNYFAAGSGQLLLSVGDPSQFQLFSLASVLFSLALLPVLLTRAKAPVPVPAARMPLRALYRLAPLGMIGVFCSGLMNASIHGLGPVYATNIGLSKEQLSLFMASLIMSGLILQWPMGRLSDRIGRGPLLVVIPIVVNFLAILGFGVLLGSFLFTIYSLSAATSNDMVGTDQRVQVAGGLLITYGAGACLGPIIGGQFMGLFGSPGLFFYFGLVGFFLAIFALLKRRRDGSPSKRKPFVVVPATQATSNQLYVSVHDESPETVILTDKVPKKS